MRGGLFDCGPGLVRRRQKVEEEGGGRVRRQLHSHGPRPEQDRSHARSRRFRVSFKDQSTAAEMNAFVA